MCYLTAALNPTARSNKDLADFMTLGHQTGSFRGKDSNGFFYSEKNIVTKKKKDPFTTYFAKREGMPNDVSLKQIKRDLGSLYNITSAVHHHRASTVGGNSLKASHPFNFAPIIGVHNGTCYGYHDLPKDVAGLTGLPDSAYIFKALSEVPEEEYASILEKIKGDYFLIWNNTTSNITYMAGNGGREFWMAPSKRGLVAAGASEKDHLEWMLKRTDCDAWAKEPVLMEQGKLYSFEEGRTVDEVDIEKFTVNKSGGRSFAGWQGGRWSSGSVYNGRAEHVANSWIENIDMKFLCNVRSKHSPNHNWAQLFLSYPPKDVKRQTKIGLLPRLLIRFHVEDKIAKEFTYGDVFNGTVSYLRQDNVYENIFSSVVLEDSWEDQPTIPKSNDIFDELLNAATKEDQIYMGSVSGLFHATNMDKVQQNSYTSNKQREIIVVNSNG